MLTSSWAGVPNKVPMSVFLLLLLFLIGPPWISFHVLRFQSTVCFNFLLNPGIKQFRQVVLNLYCTVYKTEPDTNIQRKDVSHWLTRQHIRNVIIVRPTVSGEEGKWLQGYSSAQLLELQEPTGPLRPPPWPVAWLLEVRKQVLYRMQCLKYWFKMSLNRKDTIG